VNGAGFIQKVRKVGKARDVEVRFVAARGKGSHGRLYYGSRFTTVKDRKQEIKKGLLHAMIKQLGLKADDIL
jgi:predicted RNA binding protein YcfA (HicA-like mRNA interferase family)